MDTMDQLILAGAEGWEAVRMRAFRSASRTL